MAEYANWLSRVLLAQQFANQHLVSLDVPPWRTAAIRMVSRVLRPSIDDIEIILEHTPRDHIAILGVDTQLALGPQWAFYNPDILGLYAMGPYILEGRLRPEDFLFL